MVLVRLVVKLLKRLGIQHAHKKVQAVVVAVRDDTEDSLPSLSQHGDFQTVLVGYVLYFRQGEGGETDSGTDQNTLCCFTGGLLENAVLAQCDMVRFFLLQRFKEQVQGRLVSLYAATCIYCPYLI